MAEPFVFHFRPGPGGVPEVLYVLDLDCACGTCGHEQFQRFYHSLPFHEATVRGLKRKVEEGPLKAGYACENCGEGVGSSQVRRVSLSYGFSDDAGTIQLFRDLRDGTGGVELRAGRRLDPQAVPRWEAKDEPGRVVLEELEEEGVEAHLGRPFSVKLAWRDLLEDWMEDPEGGAFSAIGPDLWVVIDESEDKAATLMEEIEEEEFWEAYEDGDLAVISLHESVPEGLATHEDPGSIHGRWESWLSDEVVGAMEEGSVWADAYLSRSAAEKAVRRAFDVARLSYEVSRTDADLFFLEITTPTGTVYGRSLSLSSVLRRAVNTGLTPGEAGRLTAEEIIGVLLEVWG